MQLYKCIYKSARKEKSIPFINSSHINWRKSPLLCTLFQIKNSLFYPKIIKRKKVHTDMLSSSLAFSSTNIWQITVLKLGFNLAGDWKGVSLFPLTHPRGFHVIGKSNNPSIRTVNMIPPTLYFLPEQNVMNVTSGWKADNQAWIWQHLCVRVAWFLFKRICVLFARNAI